MRDLSSLLNKLPASPDRTSLNLFVHLPVASQDEVLIHCYKAASNASQLERDCVGIKREEWMEKRHDGLTADRNWALWVADSMIYVSYQTCL